MREEFLFQGCLVFKSLGKGLRLKLDDPPRFRCICYHRPGKVNKVENFSWAPHGDCLEPDREKKRIPFTRYISVKFYEVLYFRLAAESNQGQSVPFRILTGGVENPIGKPTEPISSEWLRAQKQTIVVGFSPWEISAPSIAPTNQPTAHPRERLGS